MTTARTWMPHSPQVVDELHGVGVVGDAEVGPHLLALDVAGVDAEQDVGLVLELLEEPHLDVGIEAGQDPGGVVVEEELAAELEVELAGEAAHALEDGSLLLFEVGGVVESDGVVHSGLLPFMSLRSSKRP